MPSQPEDKAYAVLRELSAEGLLPRLMPLPKHTNVAEYVQVIGQLTAKLETQGVTKQAIDALRHARFNPEKANLPEADRTLMETRAVDETLYRIQSALKSIEALEPQAPAIEDRITHKNRERLAEMQQQDQTRAEYIRQRRKKREGQGPQKA